MTGRKMIKLEISAPIFPGFYSTRFAMDNDDIIGYDLDEVVIPKFKEAGLLKPNGPFEANEIHNEYFFSETYRKVCREYESEVGTRVVDFFAELVQKAKVGLSDTVFDFVKIWSPKEYNFGNDIVEMDVLIDKDKFVELLVGPVLPVFTALVKREFTKRSGFMPLYSNSIDEWVKDMDAVMECNTRAGVCFEALCLYLMDIDLTDSDESNFEELYLDLEEELVESVLQDIYIPCRLEEFMLEFLMKQCLKLKEVLK